MDVAKYILGVASKSNVEKRQVGCVITSSPVGSKEFVVAEGYNTEEEHAEIMALGDIMGKDFVNLKAYVTHPPCPECAKAFGRMGIDEVEVIEAFMKFDGDKTRYDLIDAKFWLDFTNQMAGLVMDGTYSTKKFHKLMWTYAAGDCEIMDVLIYVAGTLGDYLTIEKGLADVLTMGARKYKPNNWRNCHDTGRYFSAAMRHNRDIHNGEDIDEESELDHRHHIFTNLMFLYCLGYTNGR